MNKGRLIGVWLLFFSFSIIGTQRTIIGTQRTITIHNQITKQMLGYRKFFKTFYPSFKLSINNKPLLPGKSLRMPVTNNQLDIRYDYSFANGMYKGGKVTQFKLNPKSSEHAVTFSWGNKWRLQLDQATPISTKRLYTKNPS